MKPCTQGEGQLIPRIRPALTFYGTAVTRQFEMMGVYSINESVAISRSRDKLRSLQLLSRKGIGMPNSGFANNPDDIQDLIKMVGGAPLVIKLLEGTQGIGVVLAETKKAAEKIKTWVRNGGVLVGYRNAVKLLANQKLIKVENGIASALTK